MFGMDGGDFDIPIRERLDSNYKALQAKGWCKCNIFLEFYFDNAGMLGSIAPSKSG